MKIQFVLLFAFALPFATLGESATNQSAQLERLLSETQAVIPDGWTAEIWPTRKGESYAAADTPRLVVYRNAKAKAYFSGVNMVLSLTGPESKPEDVLFRLECMPFLSQQEYQDVQKENEAKRQVRLKFEKKLKGMRYGHMGPHPFPPRAYDPKNEAERKLVRQYAFLWMNTAPRRLPEYFYGNLAFSGYMMENMRFSGSDLATSI